MKSSGKVRRDGSLNLFTEASIRGLLLHALCEVSVGKAGMGRREEGGVGAEKPHACAFCGGGGGGGGLGTCGQGA